MLGNDLGQQISQQMVLLSALKYSLDVDFKHEPKEASNSTLVVKINIKVSFIIIVTVIFIAICIIIIIIHVSR